MLDATVELEDDAAGGGTDLDAERTFDLSSLVGLLGDPHEQQGYHIKLKIDVPEGTHSTAYSKYKVFWVEECVTPTHSPSEPPTPSQPPSESPEPSASITTPAAVPTAVPAGAGAADGGGSAAGLLGLAVVASGAVAGTAVFARRRFLHDS